MISEYPGAIHPPFSTSGIDGKMTEGSVDAMRRLSSPSPCCSKVVVLGTVEGEGEGERKEQRQRAWGKQRTDELKLGSREESRARMRGTS